LSAALDDGRADPATSKEMMARMPPDYTPFLPAARKPAILVDAPGSTPVATPSAGLVMGCFRNCANIFSLPVLQLSETTVVSPGAFHLMKLAFHRSDAITAAGLLAATAVAFCVGRLTNPAGSSAATGADRENPAGATAPGGMPFDSGVVTGRGSQFPTDQNGDCLTIEKLTNGKPLDKWLKNLLSQEDEIVRMTGLLRFLDSTTDPADLRTALEAVKDILNAGNERGSRRSLPLAEYGMLLQRWTQLDAKGAIAFVAGRDSWERWTGATAVLRTWTRLDPTAAIAWVQENGREFSARGSGAGGSKNGSANWDFTLSTVVSELARSDIDRAMTVAARLLETNPRNGPSGMEDVLASEIVRQRGMEAARAALDALPAGTFRDSLSLTLARRFASADPAGGARWALGLAAGDTRSLAVAEIVRGWANADPIAAGNFVAKLPAGPDGDRSRESYAYAVVQKDPAASIAWANVIIDPTRRLSAVEAVARTWMAADPPGAKAWLAQNPLPDEVKARIQALGGSPKSQRRGN
jgi:hypothetical protein